MTLVFGYGSNMDDAQMDVRCPRREKVGIARIPDHRLCFPRQSGNRNCGVSSIEPSQGEVVWGVVHRLNDKDLASLDASEGYRVGRTAELNGYNRVPIVVELDGVPTEVQTYVANATINPMPPNAEYIEHICTGGRQHGLPASYQTFLGSLKEQFAGVKPPTSEIVANANGVEPDYGG